MYNVQYLQVLQSAFEFLQTAPYKLYYYYYYYSFVLILLVVAHNSSQCIQSVGQIKLWMQKIIRAKFLGTDAASYKEYNCM